VLVSVSLPSSWIVLEKTSLQKTTYLFLLQSSRALVLSSAPVIESEALCQQASPHFHSFPSLQPQSQTGKLVRGATSTNPQVMSRQASCTALLLSVVLSPYASMNLLFSCVETHVHIGHLYFL